METIEILKKVLEQEMVAEKRYAAQINSILKAFVIRKVLNEIRKEEINHANKAIELIRKIDPEFKSDFTESEIKTGYKGTDNISQIKKFLETDIEKEREAYKNYLKYSNQVEESKIKVMLIKFIEDEKQHETKILNLIDNLRRLE